MSEIMNDELPVGWVETVMGALGSVGSSKRVHQRDWKSEGVPFFRAREIAKLSRNGTVDNDLFISRELFSFLSKEGFVPASGDVMITGVGTIGVPYIVKEHDEFYFKDASVLIFKNDHGLDPRYLFFYLNSNRCHNWIIDGSTGTTVDTLTIARARDIPIPLAPLPEQKRIADKLAAVLGRVNACRARLDRVPALLKRFRQSVLAAATSGQLTEEWRETSEDESAAIIASLIAKAQKAACIKVRGGRVDPALQDLQQEIELPKKWVVVGFDALAAPAPNALKAGPFGSALKKDMYSTQGFKIYGQEQVIAGDENFGNYFINQAKFDELNSCEVKPGDILISLVGTIGKVLTLSPKCQPGIINPRLVKLSLHPLISREFIALYMRSPLAQNFFSSKSHGGTMDILNLGLLRELPILLPPTAEQAEIVRRVEALFSFADHMEARLTKARAQLERLTPAVLAKAFRGELVPQDPNDEPAVKLLEQARAGKQKKL